MIVLPSNSLRKRNFGLKSSTERAPFMMSASQTVLGREGEERRGGGGEERRRGEDIQLVWVTSTVYAY